MKAAEPTTLSLAGQVAVKRYVQATEDAKCETNPHRRVRGHEILRRITSLSVQELAILNQVAVRGVGFGQLALKTGRRTHDLRVMFASAGERLARHFETVAAAED